MYVLTKLPHPNEVCEMNNADLVVFHEPHVVYAISYIHPMACLFEAIPDLVLIRYAYKKLKEIFKKYNIHHVEVMDVLKRDVKVIEPVMYKLRKLTYISCTYRASEYLQAEKNPTITDGYKKQVLDELDVETLLSLVFSRPEIHLVKYNLNTFIAIEKININPISNLIFVEDQQIVTRKGLIMCNSAMAARKFESEVLKTCYEIMRIPIAAVIPEGHYLEGGDHLLLNNSLTLIHIGLRSNYKAVQFLMENDLLGTDKLAVIKNTGDTSQERSHLDTFFNIVNEKTVIMLDFKDPEVPVNAARFVDFYTRKCEGSPYELYDSDVPLKTFMKSQGYYVITVTHRQQLYLLLNFLHLGRVDGKHVILTCSTETQTILEKHRIKDVHLELVEYFREVSKLYGSLHSAVNVFRSKTH